MLSSAERDLLEQLAEDGWPLRVLAPNDEVERSRFRENAMSLLERGLLEVYGRADDASALPHEEAAAILSTPERWDTWFICASPAGNALLQSGQ
jgi:hypothetical protein